MFFSSLFVLNDLMKLVSYVQKINKSLILLSGHENSITFVKSSWKIIQLGEKLIA